jgi:putative heme-binding domain-containing protein
MDHGFAALRAAMTHQAQIDIARSLRARPDLWSQAQRRDYFAWLAGTASWRGGASFNLFLKNLRDEAIAWATPAEHAALQESFAATSTPVATLPAGRGLVREWTLAELVALDEKSTGSRDVAHGRRVFAMASCFVCHVFAGEGGALGPDLTGAAARLSTRDLLEAMVDPSREISDQYGTVQVTLRNGRIHSGRITNYTERGMSLAENLFDPSRIVRIPESEVASIEPSKISLMPPGLLNVLEAGEILDLLAFLRTGVSTARP